jgi:glutamine synthetase
MYIYEYIWLDGNNRLRSKTKVTKESEAPTWNYDGSSTKQANGEDSEVLLVPVRRYKDPFVNDTVFNRFLVLCETYKSNGEPHITNTRSKWSLFLSKNDLVEKEEPMFGFEQEFFFIDVKSGKPLGYYGDGTKPQGDYYCGVGSGNVYGRDIAEMTLNMCLLAGVSLTGMNFEVAPGQCEFQVCDYGVKATDDLIVFKYILERVSEKFNVKIDYHPKPLSGDWNGSGLHTNFSTKSIRTVPEEYKKAIQKLSEKHHEHLKIYGKDNNMRLTGKHETSSMEKFTSGVADRTASVRIPRDVSKKGMGYIEDRRPGSNSDPYLVSWKLVETVLL